jgi:hypothetical protein
MVCHEILKLFQPSINDWLPIRISAGEDYLLSDKSIDVRVSDGVHTFQHCVSTPSG